MHVGPIENNLQRTDRSACLGCFLPGARGYICMLNVMMKQKKANMERRMTEVEREEEQRKGTL